MAAFLPCIGQNRSLPGQRKESHHDQKISAFLLIALMLLTGLEMVQATEVEPLEYTLFAVRTGDCYVDSVSLQLEATLILNADGTGSMFFDEDTGIIESWTLSEENILTILMDDGGIADALVTEDVIELDVMGDGSYIMCFALEEADLSSYPLISLDEFRALKETSDQ